MFFSSSFFSFVGVLPSGAPSAVRRPSSPRGSGAPGPPTSSPRPSRRAPRCAAWPRSPAWPRRERGRFWVGGRWPFLGGGSGNAGKKQGEKGRFLAKLPKLGGQKKQPAYQASQETHLFPLGLPDFATSHSPREPPGGGGGGDAAAGGCAAAPRPGSRAAAQVGLARWGSLG